MLGRGDLYSYQQKAVSFIKNTPNCALWLDMGLGKSVSTLTAVADLQAAFDVGRVLVVAPLRVARKVWSDEVKRWAHLQGMTVACAVTSEDKKLTASQQNEHRMKALRSGADITTINREQMQWLEELIIQGKKQIRKWPWDMVILDESQSFKSQSSFRWKSLRRLRRLFPRCVQLTGTPIPLGYQDLWSQLYLLDGGVRLGPTETAFKERWFDPPSYEEYGWTMKAHSAKEIQAAVSDIVLPMRADDYLSLPPVVYNTIKVQMPEACRAKYKRLAREYMLETYSGRTVTAVNAGVCRGKLLQLANGSIYVDRKQNYEVLHNAKIEALLEVLEGLPKPVLIAYGFTADVDRLGDALKKVSGTSRVLSSDADFERLKAGGVDYGVLHPASAGHGLNDLHLSGSENIVWFGLSNSLEFYQQLNARLTGGHRRTGKNVVIHHLLTEDTVDEDTLSLLTRKDATQDDLTRSMANIARTQ